MGSKGRLLFDLNEPPTDDEDGNNDAVFCFQPQRAIPSSSTATSDLFAVSTAPQGIVNNHAFSHASSLSGFQPFVRHQIVNGSNHSVEERGSGNATYNFAPLPEPIDGQDVNAVLNQQSSSAEAQGEKEEGEWSDAEGAVGTDRKFLTPEESSIGSCKQMQEKGMPEITNDPVGEGNMYLNSPVQASAEQLESPQSSSSNTSEPDNQPDLLAERLDQLNDTLENFRLKLRDVNVQQVGMDYGIKSLRQLVVKGIAELTQEINKTAAELNLQRNQTANAMVALSGQITRTEQVLSIKIDTVQASLGTQLQELLDCVHRGDTKKGEEQQKRLEEPRRRDEEKKKDQGRGRQWF